MNLFSGLKEFKYASMTSMIAEDAASYSTENESLVPGDDEKFMGRALHLARKGIYTTHPNPAVGCVIVKAGKIIGEGWHEFAGEAHAETIALKQAGKASAGATMYVTLEPCSHHGKTPPCVKAIIKSGISRVVIAMEDPNPLVNRSGISDLQHTGIDVLLGIGQIQAKQINRGFLKRITTGLPWVTLKIATSLDGKTAMSDGESQWITSEPARKDAHKLRAAASGIITGIGTVLCDDPNMNARLEGVQRQPLRIILDTNLSTPPNARILSGNDDVLIITASTDENTSEIFPDKSVEVVTCPTQGEKINLNEAMLELGRREMNAILLEAGSRLCGTMLDQGFVDEIIVYMAPDLIGSNARDMFSIPGIEKLSDKVKLEYKEVIQIGRDLKITLAVN